MTLLATLPDTLADPIATDAAFVELDACTSGTVALLGDAAYDGIVSPCNLAVAVRPIAVLAAEIADDVVEAVRSAN